MNVTNFHLGKFLPNQKRAWEILEEIHQASEVKQSIEMFLKHSQSQRPSEAYLRLLTLLFFKF